MIVYGNPGSGRDNKAAQPIAESEMAEARAHVEPKQKRGGKPRKPCIADGKLYPSVSAAAKSIGCSDSGLYTALHRGRTKCCGVQVCYATEE